MARRSIQVNPPEPQPPVLRLTVEDINELFNMFDELPLRYAPTIQQIKQYVVAKFNQQNPIKSE